MDVADCTSPSESSDFLTAVLEALVDDQDALIWHIDGDGVHLSVDVSDVFDYATAESELITPATIEELRLARTDIETALHGGAPHVAQLYAARRRGERPHRGAYRWIDAALHPLFDAAGPPRGRDADEPTQVEFIPAPEESE